MSTQQYAVYGIARERKNVWKLTLLYAQLIVWHVVTKLSLGVVYLWVIAEGLRMLIPALSQPLRKIPMLHWLGRYEEFYRADLAQVFSVFLLVAVWTLLHRLLQVQLITRGRSRDDVFVTILGVTTIVIDSALFYAGMCQLNWGGTVVSFAALVATGAYDAVLLFVAYIGVLLKEKLDRALK